MGIPGIDYWTAIQFDLAVQFLGVSIENKLHERHKDGTAKHTLKQLLADEPEHNSLEEMLMSLGGGISGVVSVMGI